MFKMKFVFAFHLKVTLSKCFDIYPQLNEMFLYNFAMLFMSMKKDKSL